MPRDGAATRTRILDSAEALIERSGFAATSLDQILTAAGTSKGAFFHHFRSKQDLARVLVDRYVDADLALLAAGLEAVASIEEPVERVLGFLGYYEHWADTLVSQDSACLYIALLTERELLDEQTTASLERAIRGWREGFADLLRPALDERGVQTDVGALADHLFVTFEGGYLMCRAARSAEPMRTQLRVLRELVACLLQLPAPR